MFDFVIVDITGPSEKRDKKIRGCSYQINPIFRVAVTHEGESLCSQREPKTNPYSVEPLYLVKRKSLLKRNCYRIRH